MPGALFGAPVLFLPRPAAVLTYVPAVAGGWGRRGGPATLAQQGNKKLATNRARAYDYSNRGRAVGAARPPQRWARVSCVAVGGAARREARRGRRGAGQRQLEGRNGGMRSPPRPPPRNTHLFPACL